MKRESSLDRGGNSNFLIRMRYKEIARRILNLIEEIFIINTEKLNQEIYPIQCSEEASTIISETQQLMEWDFRNMSAKNTREE